MLCFRLRASESVQFFQFDKDGNMFIFPPGAGCSGEPRLVKPGEELFANCVEDNVESDSQGMPNSSQCMVSTSSEEIEACHISSSNIRSFHDPLKQEDLEGLSNKNFAPDTMKKIRWVTKMYREWRNYRNSGPEYVKCDLDKKDTITENALVFALCQFITEVKKIDGNEYPAKTLYDIVICVQFHLETMGFAWKILNNLVFKDIRYTLDNIMKIRTLQGVGKTVKKAQILTAFEEEYLWSLGLLGDHDAETLLNTVVFVLGKGCALRAGKEHHSLQCPPFDSQFQFYHDSEGTIFIRYSEDLGLKTNKGGIKHHKLESKVVDLYPIDHVQRCPVRLIIKYMSLLPKDNRTNAFYLQPKKKLEPFCWYQSRPVGEKRLRDTIKELCKSAKLPGYYTNHSLRSTAAMKMYRGKIDEQLIMEITGHRSLSVRSYKRTSDAQRKEASNAIFENN